MHIDWKELFPPRARRRPVPPEPVDADDDDALFADQGPPRGVDGFYCEDAAECASRRIDLRGPTDRDPGPLPMEEATEDVAGVTLRFG